MKNWIRRQLIDNTSDGSVIFASGLSMIIVSIVVLGLVNISYNRYAEAENLQRTNERLLEIVRHQESQIDLCIELMSNVVPAEDRLQHFNKLIGEKDEQGKRISQAERKNGKP